jgi:hypothetical protein
MLFDPDPDPQVIGIDQYPYPPMDHNRDPFIIMQKQKEILSIYFCVKCILLFFSLKM